MDISDKNYEITPTLDRLDYQLIRSRLGLDQLPFSEIVSNQQLDLIFTAKQSTYYRLANAQAKNDIFNRKLFLNDKADRTLHPTITYSDIQIEEDLDMRKFYISETPLQDNDEFEFFGDKIFSVICIQIILDAESFNIRPGVLSKMLSEIASNKIMTQLMVFLNLCGYVKTQNQRPSGFKGPLSELDEIFNPAAFNLETQHNPCADVFEALIGVLYTSLLFSHRTYENPILHLKNWVLKYTPLGYFLDRFARFNKLKGVYYIENNQEILRARWENLSTSTSLSQVILTESPFNNDLIQGMYICKWYLSFRKEPFVTKNTPQRALIIDVDEKKYLLGDFDHKNILSFILDHFGLVYLQTTIKIYVPPGNIEQIDIIMVEPRSMLINSKLGITDYFKNKIENSIKYSQDRVFVIGLSFITNTYDQNAVYRDALNLLLSLGYFTVIPNHIAAYTNKNFKETS
jgi:hypothetical protein